jgi:hypothetical protein
MTVRGLSHSYLAALLACAGCGTRRRQAWIQETTGRPSAFRWRRRRRLPRTCVCCKTPFPSSTSKTGPGPRAPTRPCSTVTLPSASSTTPGPPSLRPSAPVCAHSSCLTLLLPHPMPAPSWPLALGSWWPLALAAHASPVQCRRHPPCRLWEHWSHLVFGLPCPLVRTAQRLIWPANWYAAGQG